MDPKNQLSTELMNPEQPDISPKNNFQPSLMDHEQPGISPNNNQPGISPKTTFSWTLQPGINGLYTQTTGHRS